MLDAFQRIHIHEDGFGPIHGAYFFDPRFDLPPTDDLDDIIGGFIGERTLAENLEYFGEAGITVGPILDPSDLIDHEYIRGRGVVENYPDADYGEVPLHAVFPRLSGTPGSIRAPAPELGEHTDEILEMLGRDAGERARLHDAGAV